MFESLQEGLHAAIRSLTGTGRISEKNIRDGMKLVEQSLLEADVSLKVVKEFVESVTEKSLGLQVEKVLNPTEQIVKIVHDELVNTMGPVDLSIPDRKPLTILMMCGLQGSGKTTTCGKLALRFKQQGRTPMLVAADLQRPAAITQLEVLGKTVGVPVFTDRDTKDPVDVCRRATKKAVEDGCDLLILDTAGRLHIDQELMGQLCQIEKKVSPDQVYFVVDAMTGQDAINSATAFNDALELNGVILTKFDGDTRGGAALSVKSVTGVPIKFIGTGETLDDLEEFHPERIAGRILGMGDLATLIETAQTKLDEDEVRRQQELMEKGIFTLDDFQKQMAQTSRLGSMTKLLGMIPGLGNLSKMLGSLNVDPDKEIRKIGSLINSMTIEERKNPKLIDLSRKRRIAAGAGVEVKQVNDLMEMYGNMARMVKDFSKMGMGDRARSVQSMMQQISDPTSMLGGKKKGSTGKRLTPKERLEQKKRLEKERKKKKKK